MKNAKNLMMMLVLAMAVMVVSCDEKLDEDMAPQEETATDGASRLRQVGSETFDTSGMDNWTEVANADLPQTAQDYLKANYDGIGIAEGYKTETGEFVLLMDNDMVIIFNASGEKILEFDLGALLDDDHDEDDEDWDEIPLDSLPQAIKDYVATNYPDSIIEEAVSCPENDHIIVFLDSGEALEFDKDGNFVGLFDEDEDDDWDEDYVEIPVDSLSQKIKDYLAANYATATVEEAIFDTVEEMYYVGLDTDIIVVFDKDGNFIEELDEDDFEDDEDFTEVKVEDLAQAIKDYVAANYAGLTIEEAYYDEIEELFYVELSDDTILVFDKDGNFVEVYEDEDEDFTEVKIEDLLQPIKDYIATNYPNQTIEEAYFDEVEKLYYIELDNDLIVVFDKDGNFKEVLTDG